MEKPHFTLAIPLHGACPYVTEALQSALHQQDDSYRLLLVRDDDQDDSEILSLARNQVLYLRKPTRAIADNWNTCLDNASGTLCTILHQDDRLAPTYIPTIRRLHAMFPDACAYFVAARVIGPSGAVTLSLPDVFKSILIPQDEPILLRGERGLVSLLRGNWLFCPTVCYNLTRHFPWRFNSGYKMVLDLDMYCQILLSGGTIVGTHQKHYAYRRHASQYTIRLERDLARFEEEFKYYDWLKVQMRKRQYLSASKTASRRYVLRAHALLKALAFLASGDVRFGLRLVQRALS